MAATQPVTSQSPGPPEEQDDGRQPHPRVPNGYVMIVVPNDGHELPASSSCNEDAGAADADAPEEEEEERPRPPGARATSSLWRAVVAVLALAALAVAGYVCLYAGGDAAGAAWRLLETREEDDGGGDEGPAGRGSFLLPLYLKPRHGIPQNSTGNLFPEGCVQPLQEFGSVILSNSICLFFPSAVTFSNKLCFQEFVRSLLLIAFCGGKGGLRSFSFNAALVACLGPWVYRLSRSRTLLDSFRLFLDLSAPNCGHFCTIFGDFEFAAS